MLPVIKHAEVTIPMNNYFLARGELLKSMSDNHLHH
jgi:hypothetical protein